MEKPTGMLSKVEEAWLARNENQLINCPFLPGELRISENACLKRHILASRGKIIKFSDWEKLQRIGLSKCKDCPIGMRLKTRESLLGTSQSQSAE